MRALANLCVITSLLPFVTAVCLPAQTAGPVVPTKESAVAVADFSAEPAIIVDRQSIVAMHADGTGTRENALTVRLQSDAMVRQFGVISVPFAGAAEHVDFLYARVRHPDGSVVETPVDSALEQPEQVTREAPAYSDLKTKQLPVRNLTVGDTLEWRARIVRTVPESPGQFWGQDTFVTEGVALHELVELHVPVGTAVTLWTNPALAAPTDHVEGGQRVVRWTHNHLDRTVGSEAAAAAEAKKKKLLTPEEELDARKGVLPSLAWTTFPNWAAVGAWYRGLEGDRIQADTTVKAKVAALTVGKTNEIDKAQAVYDYVATQIRYVGVSFGIGRFQPHTAAEVLANQYGDCKDKGTLLAAMLSQLDLQADLVLIGAGIRFNAALPSPAAFNHLITRVNVAGQPIWLDTTVEVSPWGTLLYPIRDREALVIPQSGTAHIVTTPALPPYPAFAKLAATETLDKEFTSDARITMTFHDDDEEAIRAALRQISPTQYPEFTQRLLAGMGYGGTATEPEFSRPEDIEHPLTLSFRYKRIKEADWGENRVTTPFMPMALPAFDEKQPPVASIQLGIPRTETSTVEVKLPKGWSAELPEAVHAKAAFAIADTTFHLKDGVVTAERKLTILEPEVPATEWKSYKTWSDQAGVNSYPFLQLVPTTAELAAPPSPGNATVPPSTSLSAEQLIAQAGESLRTMNPTRATQLLDEAKALDPKQRRLWGGYAAVAYSLGEIGQAMEDVEKELTLHPDEVQMYAFLAGLQQTRGEKDLALTTLHKWVDAAPDDPAATVVLIRALHSLKRDPEAIVAGNTALTRLGKTDVDSTQLRLTLADVQAAAGEKAAAAATVLPLQKTVSEPAQQNTVAYMLADAGLDLPEDEATERGVLAKLDAETRGWTLDESPSTLATQTSLLIASWDTMGWILYREGHFSEARHYIAAAWRNADRGDLSEHLRAIDTAMHANYASETGRDQARRTFALGPANGRHGTAELRLLLAEGKVLRSEPATAPVVPGFAPASNTNSAPGLPAASDLVKNADLHALFPEGSGARLVRNGIVNCAGAICQLVLEPLSLR